MNACSCSTKTTATKTNTEQKQTQHTNRVSLIINYCSINNITYSASGAQGLGSNNILAQQYMYSD